MTLCQYFRNASTLFFFFFLLDLVIVENHYKFCKHNQTLDAAAEQRYTTHFLRVSVLYPDAKKKKRERAIERNMSGIFSYKESVKYTFRFTFRSSGNVFLFFAL